MELKTISTSLFATNCYILCGKNKTAVVVDPGSEDKRISDFIINNHLTVTHILLTHGHFDHIGGIDMVKEICPEALLIMSVEDEDALLDNELNRSGYFGRKPLKVNTKVDITVENKDVIHFGKTEIEVLSTPGHTPGGVCYYVKDENLVFTGDSLFCSDIGRCDFENSSYDDLVSSIKENLYSLPDKTLVLPGHGFSSTIGKEKTTNNYVRA